MNKAVAAVFASGIVDVSSSLDENIHTLHVAVLGGYDQGRISILVSRGLVNVGSGSDKAANDLVVPIL
jgi:hypothetical protein